jgi:hypothetical protein
VAGFFLVRLIVRGVVTGLGRFRVGFEVGRLCELFGKALTTHSAHRSVNGLRY